MTTCPTREILVSYENGELTDDAAGPIEAHLRSCGECGAAMRRIRAVNPDSARVRTAILDSVDDEGTPFDKTPVDTAETANSTEPHCYAKTERAPKPKSEAGVEGNSGALRADADRAAAGSSSGDSTGRDVRARPRLAPLRSAEWIIPDYERVLLCGEGSYGSVWAVRDRVGVYRALKMIDLERMRQAGIRCRESAALETYCRKVSRHPYLITVYLVGAAGPYLYYTMELADDRMTHEAVHDSFPTNYRPLTLDKIIHARLLQIDVAIEIARRLLRGLAKLHSLDLVHRDIKPSNIVFVNRHPKLADIGVLTQDIPGGRIIGTPRYMPPDKVMDKTADIYAFGKVLHEMLAGRNAPTFPKLPEECLWGSMRWDLERVGEVIARACADAAAERYPTAGVMLEDLEASAKLPFGSLFDGLDQPKRHDRVTISEATLQLGFAFIRTIPWILLFIAIIYGIMRVT